MAFEVAKHLVQCLYDVEPVGAERVISGHQLIRISGTGLVAILLALSFSINNRQWIAKVPPFAFIDAARTPVLDVSVVAIASDELLKLCKQHRTPFRQLSLAHDAALPLNSNPIMPELPPVQEGS